MATTKNVKRLPSGRIQYRGETFAGYNKPKRTPGKSKKSAVLAKKGNQIKLVRFGDPKMSIKKSQPGRRANFRARHNCDTAKDKFTARYWSCKAWWWRAQVSQKVWVTTEKVERPPKKAKEVRFAPKAKPGQNELLILIPQLTQIWQPPNIVKTRSTLRSRKAGGVKGDSHGKGWATGVVRSRLEAYWQQRQYRWRLRYIQG